MTTPASVPVSREGLTEERLEEIESLAANLRLFGKPVTQWATPAEHASLDASTAIAELLSEVRRLTDINERAKAETGDEAYFDAKPHKAVDALRYTRRILNGEADAS